MPLVYIDAHGKELPAEELPADALLGHRNPLLREGEKHLHITLPDGRIATRLGVPPERYQARRLVVETQPAKTEKAKA